MFCPAERRLAIDDPVLTEELMEETAEAVGLGEVDEQAVELELVLVKEKLEPGGELAAKDAAEYADGQQETWRGGDPAGAIISQAASRNAAVDVWMMLKVLACSFDRSVALCFSGIRRNRTGFLRFAPHTSSKLRLLLG